MKCKIMKVEIRQGRDMQWERLLRCEVTNKVTIKKEIVVEQNWKGGKSNVISEEKNIEITVFIRGKIRDSNNT